MAVTVPDVDAPVSGMLAVTSMALVTPAMAFSGDTEVIVHVVRRERPLLIAVRRFLARRRVQSQKCHDHARSDRRARHPRCMAFPHVRMRSFAVRPDQKVTLENAK